MTTGTDVTTTANPITGELVDLTNATTTDLASIITDLSNLTLDLNAFRYAIVEELAGRLDRLNARTETVGDYTLKTNAPTVEEYSVTTLRDALNELVDADVIDPALIDRVIVTPPPKVEPAKVDKRELNKLKKSDDRRILSAVAAARQVLPQRRTINVDHHRPA